MIRGAVRLLAFSDLHRDLDQAKELAEIAADADAVLGVGDFASVHEGLEEMIDALRPIQAPAVMVPGNNETADALRSACAGWGSATVLHGEGTEVDGVPVFGLGAGVPTTPWDWSFDLTDDEAREMLAGCPEGAVLAVHSPPKGHCDRSGGGDELGSEAILAAIEAKRPRLALCGHIHESWGCESEIGPTRVLNLGPTGTWLEV
jgi:Icc-related predicted phosphoesterase